MAATTPTATVDSARPAEQPPDTYLCSITSVDVKLAYNHDRDRLDVFIIGDINANPQGIDPLTHGSDFMDVTPVGEAHPGTRFDEEGFDDVVAAGYLHSAEQQEADDLRAAVVMHRGAYDDGGWMDSGYVVNDKETLFNAVKRHDAVDEAVAVLPGSLERDGRELRANGGAVDVYANVFDQGDALLQDFADTENGALQLDADGIYAMAKGANAATATWTRHPAVRPWTDKTGLMDVAEELAAAYDRVHVAESEQVFTLREGMAFAGGDPVVAKNALGTWGDEVVPMEADADYQAWIDRHREQAEAVSAVGDRPDDTRLIREFGPDDPYADRVRERADALGYPVDDVLDEGHDRYACFVEPAIGNEAANDVSFDVPTYGIVEEAIAGTVTRNGERYTVFDYEGQPTDFIPLVTYDPDTGGPEVYTIGVRQSGKTDLNANCRGKHFTYQRLADALDRGVLAPGYDDQLYSDLKGRIEAVAGREVSEAEIRQPLEQAGELAWTARNVAAFRATQQVSG